MAATLTPLGVSSILNDENKPVCVQVLDVKQFKETNRKRCQISDGKTKMPAMLTVEDSKLFENGDIENFGALNVTSYDLKEVNGNKLVMLLVTEIAAKTLGEEVVESVVDSPAPEIQAASTKPYGEPKPKKAKVSGRRVNPINSLNPYAGNWTIKARVTNKGDMRNFNGARGPGNLFNIELQDEQGTEIRATMWHEVATKLFDVIQVGKVYYISKGTLKPANRQYATVNNQYELTLNQNTSIEECPDEEMEEPPVVFNFVGFDNLASQIGTKVPFDVVGVVQSVGDLGSVKRKSGNFEELHRREITLVDSNSRSVGVTVWNKHAEEEPVASMAAKAASSTVVLAIKGVRATDYNGVSLGSLSRTTIHVDPADCPEADALRQWYDHGGKAQPTVSAGAGLSSSRQSLGGAGTRATLTEMQPDEMAPVGAPPMTYQTACTVAHIRPDQTMWYNACPEPSCNKKVIEENGAYWCEAHRQSFPSFKRRFIMSYKGIDRSGHCWMNCFNEQAEVLFGCTADEMALLRDQGPGEYERKVKSAQWKTFGVKVRTTTDEYNGETRRRIVANQIHPVDWAAECQNMLKAIQAL